MRKKEVKRLLKAQPNFEEWIKEDPLRVAKVRTDPSIAEKYYTKWTAKENRRQFMENFSVENLTRKTKRMHDKLQNFQTILDMVSEKNKRS